MSSNRPVYLSSFFFSSSKKAQGSFRFVAYDPLFVDTQDIVVGIRAIERCIALNRHTQTSAVPKFECLCWWLALSIRLNYHLDSSTRY